MPELMVCSNCHCTTLIHVRSVEDTFWCGNCKIWKPCYPTREDVEQTKRDAEIAVQKQREEQLS
jgi:hypothetical protein